MKDIPDVLQSLLDREAIRDVIVRYAHALDRVDEDLLEGLYWPDAIDDRGFDQVSGPEFVRGAVPQLRALFDQTQHFVGNILIRAETEVARAETYFQAYHRVREGEDRKDLFVSGRYLDDLEKREGEWRIKRRTVRIDWMRKFSDSADWQNLPSGTRRKMSGRKPDDYSQEHFGTIHPFLA